jgi:xanthine dehydrogenase YagS FAD-binding subunit
MKDFTYSRAASLEDASLRAKEAGVLLMAGGTTLLDLAKCGVTEPDAVIDIGRLSGLADIRLSDDGLHIGALARMSDVADHEGVKSAFPAIAQSLSLAASPQLRNMATIGGNLMQRTRCAYFRDPGAFPACNKRQPGSGCSALGGVTRNHAVLGTSLHCIASYPGDLAAALIALDAVVELQDRQIAIGDFFLEPGETPHVETVLQPGEIVTGLFVPASPAAHCSTYLKVRDRASYEFAAASAAVALDLHEDGRTIRDLRVALGGVATTPWRARSIEQALIGKTLDESTVAQASLLAVEGAVAHGDNYYKIDLVPRVVTRAILTLGGLA